MFVTVDKETAKRMIDAAPGDLVTIITFNRTTLIHQPTERRSKSYGKSLVDMAKDVSYDENEIYKTLFLEGEARSKDNILRNILFPKFDLRPE